MTMTYEQLAQEVARMTLAARQQTATMYIPGVDEYVAIGLAMTDEDNDVLGPNHVVIVPEN